MGRERTREPRLLMQRRQPLLKTLPKDTEWFKIRMIKEDIESLRVINEKASWNILSDSTGKLNVVAVNFLKFLENPPELPHILLHSKLTLQQYFNNLMKSIQKFRSNAGGPKHSLVLILIGASKEGHLRYWKEITQLLDFISDTSLTIQTFNIPLIPRVWVFPSRCLNAHGITRFDLIDFAVENGDLQEICLLVAGSNLALDNEIAML